MLPTPENAERPPGTHPINRGSAAHWACSGLSLTFIGLVLAETVGALRVPGPAGWPEAALVLAATASTLISLSRRLPGQNVFLAATIIAVIGGFVQVLGTITAVPFGPYLYTQAAGPRLLGLLPWWVPLVWVIVILNSRGVARLILRPWRKARTYGLRLIGLTTVLSLLCDFGLEPFAARMKGYVLWSPTRLGFSWYGAPVTNFAGWTVTALLMLAFVTPALINKSPVKHPPDYHPLALWSLLNTLFAAGAITHQFWLAAAVSSGALLITLIFAVRGARW